MFGRFSALTVAGLCWIFTSFPCTNENFDYVSECTLFSEQLNADFSVPNWRDWPCFWPWRAGFFPPAGRTPSPTRRNRRRPCSAARRPTKRDSATRRSPPIPRRSQADASNVEAWRARGRDYQAAGDRQKAQADFDKAIETAARRRGELPGARRVSLRPPDRPERAIHDYTLAINLKLERTEVYTARGKAYTAVRAVREGGGGFHAGDQAAAGQSRAVPGARHRARRTAQVSRRGGRFRFLHRAQAGSRGVLGGARAGLHRHQRFHPRARRSRRGAEAEPATICARGACAARCASGSATTRARSPITPKRCKRDPKDPRVYMARSAVYVRLKMYAESLEDRQQAVQLDPKNPGGVRGARRLLPSAGAAR